MQTYTLVATTNAVLAKLQSCSRGFLAGRNVTWLIVTWLCICGLGCEGNKPIWTAEIRSPDGLWVASAQTIENGGFGTAANVTVIYLKRANVSEHPQAILSFFHDSSLPHQTGEAIHLEMKWETPSHLEVTYDGHADLTFQVVKYGGVEISVKDLATLPSGRPA